MLSTSNNNPKHPEKYDCSPTILIAGEDGMRRNMVHKLRLDGYVVLEACDGAEALRIVIDQSRRIHVLLMDMSMPGTNLAETPNPCRPEMRTLFFTGHPENLRAQMRQILKPAQR